jgi:opacity protein-like surface antigen
MTVARADDPLGLYIGAAYSRALIKAQFDKAVPGSSGEFDSTNSSAFKGMLGIRPISFLGAEVAYMDLGRRSVFGSGGPIVGRPFITSAQASQKGESAFAVLYLPVPVIDAYLKGGLSRITTQMSVSYQINGVGDYTAYRDLTEVGLAYGAGLQWKLGQWAVRGEYERFDAAGANPSLFSIGMTYWVP